MNPALLIPALALGAAFALGLMARSGRDMNLEQWTVGGRGFGSLFVFLLLAGEIYTTFTFLGGSGWAYGRGAPALYILCYGAIAYAISYFLLPAIWRHGTRLKLHSQADFFARRYRSRGLGMLVALVGVAAIVPYLVLQLKGLGIIVSEASYGAIGPAAAVWIGTTVLVSYVVVSGIHGSAWTAVLKDAMILVVCVGLGVYLPYHLHGGYQPMFEAIERAKPGFLTLPARGQSVSWFLSTVALTALGFWMWPHGFATTYAARDEEVFRRNAAVMPLYQLVLLYVLFVGFAALLAVPGLKGTDADLSLLRVCKLEFSRWVVGVIGAAGVLTALVPGSMLLMTSATILSKNVVGALSPGTGEEGLVRLARALVPVVALLAVVFTLHGGTTLVPLLLMGYNLVTQLFPALVLALGPEPLATRAGAFAGILAGVATVAWISLTGLTLARVFPTWPEAVVDLNVGIVALAVNAAVTLAVSAATRPRGPRAAAA